MSPANKPKIILASRSQARRTMLEGARIKFDIVPPDVDESKIANEMQGRGYYAPGIALGIAKEKALAVAAQNKDALVIGSDQTLEFEEKFIFKSKTPEDAKKKFHLLRGETHKLVSAVCIARNDKVIWSFIDEADMTMHDLSDAFIDHYCEKAGGALTQCVGGYEYEAMGAWLFSAVRGTYHTILGMPLIPLLHYLRTEHGVLPE